MSLVAFLRLNGITQAQDYAVLPVNRQLMAPTGLPHGRFVSD